MARRRRSELKSLADLVRRVHPAPEQLDHARVLAWWMRALPERIVLRARPVRLAHGTLLVNVSSSAWAQELHHMHDDLLARLRAGASDVKVHHLRFRVGPLPELPYVPRPGAARPRPIPLAELPEELGRALATVPDDALREKIAAAAAVTLRAPDVRRAPR